MVQTLETIQRRAWEVREYGGQERTYFAIATATGNPISAPIRSEMAALHKRAVFALNTLGFARDYAGLPDKIFAEIENTRAFYFGEYDAVRRGIMTASDAGAAYPISFTDFFTLSSDALGRAVVLSGDAGSAIRVELDRITHEAGLELAAYWVMLAFAMAIFGFQIFYTRYSVAKRMGGVTHQGHSQNISKGGAVLRMEGDFYPNQAVIVRFSDAGGPIPARVKSAESDLVTVIFDRVVDLEGLSPSISTGTARAS
ncbi:MAG: hypothetical protein NXI16_10385 [Alphaproteobacteria bacterium]|nr:hypothetical protein [Alphaproteobacteria bacterium]